jgi:hypothetical protein
MQPVDPPAIFPEREHRCRFCEEPIAPGSGVVAAPRLAPRASGSGPPLPVFGKTERFHALCVPQGYRNEKLC